MGKKELEHQIHSRFANPADVLAVLRQAAVETTENRSTLFKEDYSIGTNRNAWPSLKSNRKTKQEITESFIANAAEVLGLNPEIVEFQNLLSEKNHSTLGELANALYLALPAIESEAA